MPATNFTSLEVAETLSTGGAYTPTGGIAAAGGFVTPSVFHTGGVGPTTTTTGTDTTPSVTESYIAEVFVPANKTLTGIAVLNGSAAAGNVTVGLANSSGVFVANSASVAQSGTAAYQSFPFATAYAAKGPARYYVVVTFDSTSARFRTHILGNFNAGKLTGQTYGTLATFTPPSTFTTNLGPIADVY